MNPTTILEADFLTFESNTFVIPDDPTRISPTEVPNATNPHSIGAVLMKDGRFSSVYSVVLTIHSLYQGRYNILIDQIALIVIDRPVTSSHLNVWANKSLVHYNTTRYGIAYHGEGSGTILPAKYLELPDGYTQLTHNETDHLAVQIISQTLVDLQFKIQITYHVATETKRYMLQLPEEGKGIFEVVFSNQSNWHPYRLQSGHLVASK